jgi:hypothetical protein
MMNVTEIIGLERESVLDDAKEPYLWSNTELVFCLNEAINELCRDSWIITDQTTPSMTQLKLLSNVGLYALDDRIVNVKSARLASGNQWGRPLTKTSENKLDQTIMNWRARTGTPREYALDAASTYLSVYPKFDTVGEVIGSADISFAAASKKITKPGATFTTHFSVGDSFQVSGTVSNNGYLTVASVIDTEITVNETLVDEVNTSAILRKVRDTLLMIVNRIPLTPLTANDIDATPPISPEIKSIYHGGLLDGIAKRAFLKQDAETYDPQKAERHRLLFEQFKGRVKTDLIRLTAIDDTMAPRLGNL